MRRSLAAEPLVSVVVPAYNAARYLDECLASICGQTHRNLEVIVVDDGSTDDTPEIIQGFSSADSRVSVLTQQNKYAGVARNNGFSQARGDYVIFLDADDVFEPTMIEQMVERAEEACADVVVCRSVALDGRSGLRTPLSHALHDVDMAAVYSGEDLGDRLFQFCVGWPWDKLYRAEFVRQSGLRFQGLRTTNDAYFVFLSLALANRIAFVDEACVLHRVCNSESLEGTRAKSFDNALKAFEAIGSALKERGCYETFSRSFVNWMLDFALWNYSTLDPLPRHAFLLRLREFARPWIPCEVGGSYYLNEANAHTAELLQADGDDLLKCAFRLEVERQKREVEFEEREAELKKREAELIERNCLLRDENERLTCLVEEKERSLESIVGSTTYKTGKALMTIPCALKDLATGAGR